MNGSRLYVRNFAAPELVVMSVELNIGREPS